MLSVQLLSVHVRGRYSSRCLQVDISRHLLWTCDEEFSCSCVQAAFLWIPSPGHQESLSINVSSAVIPPQLLPCCRVAFIQQVSSSSLHQQTLITQDHFVGHLKKASRTLESTRLILVHSHFCLFLFFSLHVSLLNFMFFIHRKWKS